MLESVKMLQKEELMTIAKDYGAPIDLHSICIGNVNFS